MEKRKIGLGRTILLIICAILFIISFLLIVKHFADIKKTNYKALELSQMVEETDSASSDDNSPDYSALIERNKGFVGWITVPNTHINYPVVKYSDNSFYLNHNFDKEYDKRGSVFMDCHNDPINLDANTILYAHNFYDTTMFSELTQYDDVEFYKKTPVFSFNTVEKKYKWKIYGVFITNATASEDNGYIFNYIYPYMDGDNFDKFISEVNKRRLYTTDVDINDDDKMLILSTCDRTLDLKNKYGKTTYRADTRIVILARALRQGESEEVDVSRAAVNPNPKYPQLWYDKKGIENPYKNDEKWYPQEVTG